MKEIINYQKNLRFDFLIPERERNKTSLKLKNFLHRITALPERVTEQLRLMFCSVLCRLTYRGEERT